MTRWTVGKIVTGIVSIEELFAVLVSKSRERMSRKSWTPVFFFLFYTFSEMTRMSAEILISRINENVKRGGKKSLYLSVWSLLDPMHANNIKDFKDLLFNI